MKRRALSINFRETTGACLLFRAVMVLVLVLCSCPAGHGIEKIYSLNSESTSGDAVLPLADGYLVLSDHGTRQNFTKFSLNGKSILSKDFLDVSSVVSGATDGYPHSAVRTSDGGYLISGLINPRPQKGYLIKIDANLSFAWGKIFTHKVSTLDMWMGSVREASDGSYIVAVKGQYADRFTYQPFVGIVKLNPDGSLVWQKRVTTGGRQNEVFDIHETADAYVLYNGLSINPNTNDWDLTLLAVNKSGTGKGGTGAEPLWGFALGGGLFDGVYQIGEVLYPRGSGIVQIDATHLAVAAYTKSFGVNPESAPGDTNGKSVLLASFLADGSTLTGLAYLDGPADDLIAGPYGGTNFIRLSDGNLLLGGLTTSNWASTYPGAFLAKITPNLQSIVWQRVYTPYTISGGTYHLNSGALFQAVAETAAGEIAAVGKVARGGAYETIFGVFPSDGLGDFSCLYTTTPQLTLTQLTGSEIDYSLLNCAASGFCLDEGLVNMTAFSAPASSTPQVSLSCYPQIAVSPSSLQDFGSVGVNYSSPEMLFTVTNSASCPNRLIQDPFLAGQDASQFKIFWLDCPYSLDPGESCTFTVTFKPTSPGPKSGILRVSSNDPNTPEWDVSLTGTAFNLVGDFSGAPTSGSAPLSVMFTDLSNNSPTSWSWNFGDGTTSSVKNPVHNFKAAGVYSVSLTATATGGVANSDKSNFITVAPCPKLPVIIRGTALSSAKIQDACDAAAPGASVQVQALDFTENLNLTNPATITLQGGYGCEYASNPEYTTIHGAMTISGGKITVEKLILK